MKHESESRSVMSDSLRPHGLYSPWNSPGQNTGVGSLSLLQGIFSTQGSNPGLPHCRRILYQLSHIGCFYLYKLAFKFSLCKYLKVDLLDHLLVLFHIGCANLHSLQQCTRALFYPHPCRRLLFAIFTMIALWTDVK